MRDLFILMARPTSSAPKNHRVTIRLSESDWQLLQQKANSASLSVSDYIRFVSLQSTVVSHTPLPELCGKIYTRLGLIGTLLEQCLRQAEQQPSSVSPISADILDDLFKHLSELRQQLWQHRG